MSLTPSTSIGKVKVTLDWSKYNKKYKTDWEKLPECEGWLTRALGADPTKARCKVCRKELKAHLGDIKKHAASETHQHMVRITQGGKVHIDGYHIGPKYTRQAFSYREEWEDEPECEGWLTKSPNGARCNVCSVDLMPKLNELKKHGKSQRHLKAMSSLWDKQGLAKHVRDELKPSFQPWQLPDIKKRDFELKLSLLGVENQFRGVKELCAILEEKLGAETFSMTAEESVSHFKLSVATHFKEVMRNDLKDAPYSLVLDDSTNMIQPGQVSVCIFYYSKTKSKVVSGYLGLIRIDRDDSNVIVESLVEKFAEWELYGYNMISINIDGISEVMGNNGEELMELLKPTCPNMIQLHSSYSAISQALCSTFRRNLPSNLEFMVRESYNWFASDPARQVRHRNLIETVNLTVPEPEILSSDDGDIVNGNGSTYFMRPIAPDFTQWLHISDFTAGLFMHYDALKKHFKKYVPICHMSKLISAEFENERNRLYFTSLQPILTSLSILREPEHCIEECMDDGQQQQQQQQQSTSRSCAADRASKMCDRIETFFFSVASKILSAEQLKDKSGKEICETDLEDFLNVDEVDFGPNFATVLAGSPLSQEDKEEVKIKITAFFKDFFVSLQYIFKDVFTVMENFQCFFLPNFLANNLERKHLIAPFFDQTEEHLDEVLSKYGLMKMLDWKKKTSTVSAFWQEIHNFGDATGNYPLRVLSSGVWKMFCVPLFSEEVSSTFNQINKVRSEHRAMDLELLEEILVCKMFLKSVGLKTEQFQPPPSLMKMERN